MYAIVIPNRFQEAIDPLLESIREKISDHPTLRPPIIIVADGHERDYGFKMVRYNEDHFVFSRAAHLGINAAPADSDIILMNDDCVLLEWNFFERFAQLAQANPFIGILSPLIVGCAGNPIQRWHEKHMFWTPAMDFIHVSSPEPVCFPCVYLKRAMLDQIGLMNEWQADYGGDDVNLCDRARSQGWKTSVTQRITIQHGDGSEEVASGRGRSWNYSYMRRYGTGSPPGDDIQEYLKRMQKDGRTREGVDPPFRGSRAKVRYFKV
jgi:hypothetical protein